MTENAPSPVFYASAKPETPKTPQKEDSKLVKGVKNTLNKWWERVGPKSVENHFVKAHENILASLDSTQRKEVFGKEIERWRKTGKVLGIAATVIDTGLAGVGFGLSVIGLRNPTQIADTYEKNAINIVNQMYPDYKIPQDNLKIGAKILLSPFDLVDTVTEEATYITAVGFTDKRRDIVGKSLSSIPSIGSVGILLGSGPGHWLAHLAAGGKEKAGIIKAKTNNYVDSGKAAEHASKVGNAIGKAATETAKWAAEHPDEIRKTVETVSKVKKEHAESAQKIAQAKQKAADAKLDAEYADWVAHHPDKTYFEQSGTPPPSKADYVEMKEKDAAAKKANKEAEERGVAR